MATMLPTDATSGALPPVSRVGLVGLGNMGDPMARNLLRRASTSLTVTARSLDRAKGALDAGAAWAATGRELAEVCDAVIVMVPGAADVESVVFAPDGLASAGGDLVVVVCSTIAAADVRRVDDRLRAESDGRMRVIDAPASGGTEGAEAGTLSILVGGDDETVQRIIPVLRACGTPVHLGPLGSGEVAKAANQLIVAATMTAVAEACIIAERAGIDLAVLLPLLNGGYAGSRVLETKIDRLVHNEYEPGGAARFMVKDLASARDEAASAGASTPLLHALSPVFDGLVAAGYGDQDLAVVRRYLAGQTGAQADARARDDAEGAA